MAQAIDYRTLCSTNSMVKSVNNRPAKIGMCWVWGDENREMTIIVIVDIWLKCMPFKYWIQTFLLASLFTNMTTWSP
jgi:hypothetical protein